MFFFSISFLLGDLYLQTFSHLPTLIDWVRWISFILIILLLTHTASKKLLSPIFIHNIQCFCVAFILGFGFSAGYAHSILSSILPQSLENKKIEVIGYIASIPIIHDAQTNFLFKVMPVNTKSDQKRLVRLSWRNPPTDLQVGDEWRFIVKMKRVHGLQNQGGFDYEAVAMENGLSATGYIIDHQFLSHHAYRYPIHFLRQALLKKLDQYLPNSPTAGWLKALTVGERSHIAQSQWQILRKTGTNHLMAIAGLHIGIVAGLIHLLGSWCWRLIPGLMLWLPAQFASAIMAWFGAIFYSALAGFSLPTQRASIMVTIFIFALLLRRNVNVWSVWSFALLIVLLCNPLSVLSESFWLSFSTIALIIYGMAGRVAPIGWWWRYGRVQWVIGLGLIPLTLVLFQECSFISFIANSIAIPWLAFLILPFCLLGSLLLLCVPSWGAFLLASADSSLSILWKILTWLSERPLATWHQPISNHWILFCAVIAILFLLAPSGFPGRWLGVIWLGPLMVFQPDKPAPHHFWITLLDVGQGLAVVVQTKSHVLIYDAGAKFSDTSDMGERVVIPYLLANKISTIDALVISHGDNDHIGGARAILETLPVQSIKTSVVKKFLSAQYCLRGDQWNWDGVDFSFLYPTFNQLDLGNDSSCVLRIDNGQYSVLLTGDIEKFAQQTLVNLEGSHLASTILIAPHHGSKTSGLQQFVEIVHPKIVLYSIGYRNRYHFPHVSIVEKYNSIHAQQFNTAENGMIRFKIDTENLLPQPELYRIQHKKYWFVEKP